MKTLLIRGAVVVDPSQGYHEPLDVLIAGGRIERLEPDIDPATADAVVDASGLALAPGFVDLHTHLREPGGEEAETIESGTRAAAAGGFTTIFAMPNTTPVCDTRTGVNFVLSRAAATGCVRVVPIAAVTLGSRGEELTNFGILSEAGAGAFSDDGRPVGNSFIMRRALEYTRMLKVPIFNHCEDLALTADGVMHEGVVSLRLGLRGISPYAESIMVARDAALAEATGGHVHVCHVSTRASVETIRAARRNGVHITAEVTPHHLTLTHEAVGAFDTNAKMKPPLCTEDDRRALIEALEDGTIDCIATDHAPHSRGAKSTVFDAAPFGIIGFETAFALLYTRFVSSGRWTLDFLIERMTSRPASVVHKPWGTLQPGASADLVLLRLDHPWRFDESAILSRSKNTPYLGETFTARIAATFYEGRKVFESQHLPLVATR